MNFWKLQMNDRNFLLTSARREHMSDVTLCSEQMQHTRQQSFEGRIVGEDIRFQIVEDQNSASTTCTLEAMCCLGYWYMKQFERDTCHIRIDEQTCRMKCFRNLVTLEIREHAYRMPEAYEIQDAMHFSTTDNSEALIPVYCKAYHEELLHKIALGASRGGKSLLRWSNNNIYLSAPVYMDYEGFVRKCDENG